MNKPTKFLNRNFVLLWQGQFVSLLGSQVMLVALVFWIKHATGSAAAIGIIQMVSSLPAVALGPIAGTIADRHSRRTIIILSDVLRGVAICSLAALMMLAPDASGTTLAWLTAVLVFTSIVSAFFGPAITAAIPDLVPSSRVASANSLAQFAAQLTLFVGQGLGGTLFRLMGAPVLFLVNGVTYLFSAVSIFFVTIPQNIPERRDGWQAQLREFKRDTLEGFHYVWNNAGLRALVLISTFTTFFTVPIIILLPFYVEDFLKAAPDWYGFLLAAYGAGAMIGYVLAGSFQLSGQARAKLMMLAIVLESVGYILLGLVRDPATAVGMAALGGIASGFVGVNITTILQVSTPSAIRGRVFGLLSTVAGSLAPLAMGLAGVVADLVNQNIPLIYLACGVMLTVLSLLVLLNPDVRTFLAYEGEEEPAPAGVEHLVAPVPWEP